MRDALSCTRIDKEQKIWFGTLCRIGNMTRIEAGRITRVVQPQIAGSFNTALHTVESTLSFRRAKRIPEIDRTMPVVFASAAWPAHSNCGK